MSELKLVDNNGKWCSAWADGCDKHGFPRFYLEKEGYRLLLKRHHASGFREMFTIDGGDESCIFYPRHE